MDKKEVDKIAVLARLALSEEDRSKYSEQLVEILDYVDQLKELEITDVDPMGQPLVEKLNMADDVVDEFGDVNALTENAPDFKENFYRVKKVIE